MKKIAMMMLSISLMISIFGALGKGAVVAGISVRFLKSEKKIVNRHQVAIAYLYVKNNRERELKLRGIKAEDGKLEVIRPDFVVQGTRDGKQWVSEPAMMGSFMSPPDHVKIASGAMVTIRVSLSYEVSKNTMEAKSFRICVLPESDSRACSDSFAPSLVKI